MQHFNETVRALRTQSHEFIPGNALDSVINTLLIILGKDKYKGVDDASWSFQRKPIVTKSEPSLLLLLLSPSGSVMG